jgi:hypothetical protein
VSADAAARPYPSGAIRAELEGCAGRHPAPPLDGAWGIEWLPVAGRPDAARVQGHTCERCRDLSYELLMVGGAFVVRRTRWRGVRRAEVHETARVRRALAVEWWRALLTGAAQ